MVWLITFIKKLGSDFLKERKIAVVTLYGEFNYGNRLQNYAVHKTLEIFGYIPQTITNKEKQSIKNMVKHCIVILMLALFPNLLMKYKPEKIREKRFKDFTKKYINTRYFKGNVDMKNCVDDYEHFVVGSDQVWNPTFGGFDNQYDGMFLTFAPKEKRVCISPSIGVSELPEEWIERFKEGFNGFNKLCVREQSGANLIKKLTGRDAEVLIDPTLMLDAKEWLKVSKKASSVNKPYVLEYFLGERDEDKLNQISKENNLERVTLLDKNNRFYTSGPGEFLDLISKADMVCTDSFHACVFSIIFDKPFVVFRREDETKDMYSRIDTLIEMFGVDAEQQPILINKKSKQSVLDIQRKKVIDFLKESL